jgi:hypothetical protein
MNNKLTQERVSKSVREDLSVLENPEATEDNRYSTESFLNIERSLLSNANKRLTGYFALYALCEYFLLFILQRYFFVHKSVSLAMGEPPMAAERDLEACKFFVFRTLPLGLILINHKKGTAHIRLILQDARTNKSFTYFVLFDVCITLCMISLLDGHIIASVLLASRSKNVYFMAKRFLRGFHMRKKELILLVSFVVYLIFIYFWNMYEHFLSILLIIVAGGLFYFNEETASHHITLHEYEILDYAGKLIVVLLLFVAHLTNFSSSIFMLEWSDLAAGTAVALLELTRIYLFKNIQKYSRENSARTYQPQMICFTAVISISLAVVFWETFLSWSEFLGCIALTVGLMYYEWDRLQEYIRPKTQIDYQRDGENNEELLVR